MYKVTHLTSLHTRYDVRIFTKMCISLAKIKDYDVSLVVADGKSDETCQNVRIIDVGIKTSGRITRMTSTVYKVFKKAIALDSDIYHLHDPELIFIGLLLIARGKKVIFDAHEDLPVQVRNKPYLNFVSRAVLSKLVEWLERLLCPRFSYIVAATPFIREKFLRITPNSIDINNYPIIEHFNSDIDWNAKKNEICYLGGISKIRGIVELVQAMSLTKNVILNLVGLFEDIATKQEVENFEGWNRVKEYGYIERDGILKVLEKSKIGMVTLHPIENYLDSLPIKLFEYMSAGIPVIASDFDQWKQIVEGANCGICVNPLNPKEIAEAINTLMSNDKLAMQMGQNGAIATKERYNWAMEEKKLYKIYNELLTKSISQKH